MTVRFLVSGMVQGVGFRYFTARRAQALQLAGWVRNLPDGRVEVVASGDPSSLEALETALGSGPAGAAVSGVEKSQISDEIGAVNSFNIK